MTAMQRPDGDVLLFSPGMDSLIASKRFPNAKKLYINIGSQYAEKEMDFLERYYGDQVTLDARLTLADMERDDAIVPARNLFLVAIASLYGSRVLLSAVDGDGSTDKDLPFAAYMSELLSHIYSPPHFIGGETTVALPMREHSKPEWVAWYLKQGFDPGELVRAVSCYHPTLENCGCCKACIRKWVALESNGIHLVRWNRHPAEYDWKPFIERILTRTWRCPSEDAATEMVLRRYGIIRRDD